MCNYIKDQPTTPSIKIDYVTPNKGGYFTTDNVRNVTQQLKFNDTMNYRRSIKRRKETALETGGLSSASGGGVEEVNRFVTKSNSLQLSSSGGDFTATIATTTTVAVARIIKISILSY